MQLKGVEAPQGHGFCSTGMIDGISAVGALSHLELRGRGTHIKTSE